MGITMKTWGHGNFQPICRLPDGTKSVWKVRLLTRLSAAVFGLFLALNLANAQIINTVAGGGVGDGGAAASASLASPLSVAVDGAGNLYVAEYFNHRVRKITVATGVITTVAGNGSSGFAGDGGAATSAGLSYPSGVALDSAGNLYIADTNNHRIRKITAATGVITTVAGNGSSGFAGDGGVATSTSLSYPSRVAVDGAGNLYVADTYNHRIRKIMAITGAITTVAGNGTSGFAGDGGAATSASLKYPYDVALDSAGNLYVADSYNHRIRKITVATGVITTVAGNGTSSFAGDGGVATNASLNYPSGVTIDGAGTLYVADTANFRIRKITAATGVISTVAGNGSSGLAGDGGAAASASLRPFGVALDSAGNLYVADADNGRIRKLTAATGVINTVAGIGYHSFAGEGGAATSANLDFPQGVALDSAGNLYIADTKNHRIRKITAATGVITTEAGNGRSGFWGDDGVATSADLDHPSGVALDSAGNLYIADTKNHRIRKITAATGVITTIAGNGRSGFTGDGGAATSTSLGDPLGVAIDSAGNLYIADTNNHRIRKITVTGQITTVAGSYSVGFAGDGGAATSAAMNYPSGVTVDGAGNLYVADSGNHRIRKITAATGVITTVAGNGTSSFAGDGLAATSASLNYPRGVTADGAGNLYVADSGNHRIRKITAATGVISTAAGNGLISFAGDGLAATSASLYLPNGVAVDSAGNLYAADTANERIRKITAATGVINTVAGNGSSSFAGDGGAAIIAILGQPYGVTVDSAGNLYVVDAFHDRIRKITATTGVITTVAGNGSSSFTGDGGAATNASLDFPQGVAVDSAGNFYVADSSNNRIRKITVATGVITTVAGNGQNGFEGDGGQPFSRR